jgi:hypothetical protein
MAFDIAAFYRMNPGWDPHSPKRSSLREDDRELRRKYYNRRRKAPMALSFDGNFP